LPGRRPAPPPPPFPLSPQQHHAPLCAPLTNTSQPPPPQNTFCLCIFLVLVFVRGLAWQFSAEVLAILLVEMLIALLIFTSKNQVQPVWKTLLAGLLFPLSLLFVFVLENIVGWN
jgi:hypothetical protein